MGFYYSIQIRKKALESIAKGNTQSEVSRIFGINRITLYRWSLLKKETNDLKPKINYNIRKKKIDIEKLKEYSISKIH
jgi:transposase-like protein